MSFGDANNVDTEGGSVFMTSKLTWELRGNYRPFEGSRFV